MTLPSEYLYVIGLSLLVTTYAIVRSPTLPRNISVMTTILPAALSVAVAPIESPTVANAETVSKRADRK